MEIDLVHYYFREKLYHEMLRSTELSQESDPSDLTSNLYIGVAHFLNGRLSEALDQLQPLTSEPNIALAALLASIHIHKQCKMPDKEAIYKAEQLLKDEMKLPHETALLNAADILFMVGKIEKARDFIHRLMKLNPESLRGLVLKGWIELTEGNKKIALSCFRSALAKNPFCMDAVFGEVKIIPPCDGLSKVNQLIVRYPELSPPLVEKMRLHLSLFDWQLTIDTANRILTMDPKNLTALKVKLLYQTCFEGNYEEVSIGLGSFSSIAEEQEPQNWKLLHEAAVLFSRTCGRDRTVLASTECLLQKALPISCNNLTVVNEVAHQYYLSKKYKDATKVYRSALKINESCFNALAGLTLSAIAENGVTSQPGKLGKA
ncbi:unnamed protein product [Bemisia tabaci]|uniref:Uncharacterized protein n=1 Tax=Bemisia tabaci TaxID=7038 RepID=A0A9P0EVR8_BEMTA|nr:unnamed protein product [Bemisia tabaci]